jgi:hypothetical protein
LELRFHLPDHSLDICCRDRSFGARNADAAGKLFTVELFAGAILLDDQWCCQDGALVGAEALPAFETFAAPADSTVTIVRGIQNLRIMMLAVWAPHEKVSTPI